MSSSLFGFFGLRENPFSINPNPRFLYLTPLTQVAFQRLVDGIRNRKGLILLTGEVGTGKTLLLRRLLDWLSEQKMPTALIFNSHVDPDHLLDLILGDFGIACESEFKSEKLIALNRWLLERYRVGQTPVLIVDEAQGLPLQALEEVRLLLNLETPRQKLLQVILAGQPELEEKLKAHELRQFRQRITVRCRTAPLNVEETQAYIEERLRKAGAQERIFEPKAAVYVHAYSRGIPRVMNLICEHSLIAACAEGTRVVSPQFVESAARDCQLDQVDSVSRVLNSGYGNGSDLGEIGSIFAGTSLSNSGAENKASERLGDSTVLGGFETVETAELAPGSTRANAISSMNAAVLQVEPFPAVDSSEPNRLASQERRGAKPSDLREQLENEEELTNRQKSIPMARFVSPNSERLSSARGANRPASVSLFNAWWRSFLLDVRVTWRPIERQLRAQASNLRPYAVELRGRVESASHDVSSAVRGAATVAKMRIDGWKNIVRAWRSDEGKSQGAHSGQTARKPGSAKHSPHIAKLRRWLRGRVTYQQRRNSKDSSSLPRRAQQ